MPALRSLFVLAVAMPLAFGPFQAVHADAPYDGWRGLRAAEPSTAGGSYDRRPLDGTPRYGQPSAAPWSGQRPAAPPAYRREPWTGFYLGGHLGGAWGQATPIGLSTEAVPLDGFIGGAQAGYNLPLGPLVGGVELDGSWSSVDGMKLYGGTASAAGVNLDWMATLRGRLGVAWDNLFVYATGGVAFAGVDVDVATPAGLSGSRDTLTGLVYGAGIEMKLNAQLSARLEALRYNFGDEQIGSVAGPLSVGGDMTSIRAGLNWHFN